MKINIVLFAFVVAALCFVQLGKATRCPRACHILQPAKQTWVCPQTPGGRFVVRRDTCFILHWPEP